MFSCALYASYQVCRVPRFLRNEADCVTVSGNTTLSYSDALGTTSSSMSQCASFSYTIHSLSSFGERKSESRSVSVGFQPPPVASLNASAPTPEQIIINWKAPDFARCQVMKYDVLRVGMPTDIKVCCDGPQTQFVDSALTANTQYAYKVSTVSYTGGKSSMSTRVTATTLTGHPGVPTGFSWTINPPDVVLSWSPPTHPNGKIQKYTVTKDGSPESSLGGANGTSVRYPLHSLQAGLSYIYAVTAHTSAGLGPSAFLSVKIPLRNTPPPLSVHITVTGYSNVIISWVPSSYDENPANYNVTIYSSDGKLALTLPPFYCSLSLSVFLSFSLCLSPSISLIICLSVWLSIYPSSPM